MENVSQKLILLIRLEYANGAAAKCLRGAADCFLAGNSDAILWDTAAKEFTDESERVKAELASLGVDLTHSSSEEWPEVVH